MPTTEHAKIIEQKTDPISTKAILEAGETAQALSHMGHSYEYLYRHILHQIIMDLQKEVISVDWT